MDRKLADAQRQKAVLLEAWEEKVRAEERQRIKDRQDAMARRRNRNKICGEENPGKRTHSSMDASYLVYC
jgi:hypothetical protein